MIGPRATPAPVVAAQQAERPLAFPGRVNMLVMIARVEGMISAPPMPMLARAAISMPTEPEKAAQVEHAGEARQAGQERPLAAEAVRQAARDQQQPGEDQDVGVDDPLQVGRGGAQVAHQRRERDVQDGVVQGDDEEREAEDAQGHPASPRPDRRGRGPPACGRYPRPPGLHLPRPGAFSHPVRKAHLLHPSLTHVPCVSIPAQHLLTQG